MEKLVTKQRRITDINGISEYLHIPVNTIYSWVSQRKIPHFKIGALLRFDLDEIDAWLEERKVQPFEL